MKKIFKVAAVGALVLSMGLGAAGCGGSNNAADTKHSQSFVQFITGDKDYNAFINEFLARHLRYDDRAIDSRALGSSVMFNKEYEALSLMWFDSTAQNVSSDRHAMVKRWLTEVPVDRFGYVWSNFEESEPALNNNPTTYFNQGWPFPAYTQANGESAGWEFNETAQNWKVYARSDDNEISVTPKVGAGLMTAEVEASELIFESPVVDVNTFYAPFIALDLRIDDKEHFGLTSGIEDIYISWKTQGQTAWSSEQCVSYSAWATTGKDAIPSKFSRPLYFPLYLHDNYGTNQTIEQIRVSVKTKSDKDLKFSSSLNYVRLSFDSRRIDNNAILTNAARTYWGMTQDKEFLEEMMPRLRMAMQFMLSHMQGETGLVSAEYFVGHDGRSDLGIGHGIAHSYWDIIAFPEIDLQANIAFYKQLRSLAALERAATDAGIPAQAVKVASPENNGEVAYTMTAESLDALADTVREKIQTHFWNEETGRFMLGIVDRGDTQEKIDYGYVHFNLEAVANDIATTEQAKSVMDWITGVRTVEGDDSTGADIYKFEFAPRTSTKHNSRQYYWGWHQQLFGNQMQDGGAVLFTSYYDMIARQKVYGVENAFERFAQIQSWYKKVKSYGGEGENFYRTYYVNYDVWESLGTTLQGNGGAGGLGVDAEFLESALLYAVLPYGYLGMEEGANGSLSFSPDIPKKLGYVKIENMMFGGKRFDVTAKNNSLTLSAVAEGATGNVTVTFKCKDGAHVYVDGVMQNAESKNGKITVSVPLKNCTVTVK